MKAFCAKVGLIADSNGWFSDPPASMLAAPDHTLFWCGTMNQGEYVSARTREEAKQFFQRTHEGVRWCATS